MAWASHSLFIGATWVAAIFGGIGVAAAFVSAIVGYQLTEDALNEASVKIAQSNAQTAVARAEAAKANEEVARANERTAQIYQSLQPRQLTEAQAITLGDDLKGKISALVVAYSEGDSGTLAWEIWHALRRVGIAGLSEPP